MNLKNTLDENDAEKLKQAIAFYENNKPANLPNFRTCHNPKNVFDVSQLNTGDRVVCPLFNWQFGTVSIRQPTLSPVPLLFVLFDGGTEECLYAHQVYLIDSTTSP